VQRILIASDNHAGAGTGLTPPRFHNDENRSYLGPFWDWYVERVEEIGRVDAFVHLGDAIDGPGKRENTYHISTDLNKQVDMAVEAIEKVRADRVYIVQGTGYHTDDNCSFEQFVASQLNTDAIPEVRLEVHGRRFLGRHVVGRSDIPYGQYTQLGKELINEILQGELEGHDKADLHGRAHVHYMVRIGMLDAKTGLMKEAWTNPALQLRGPNTTAFVRKLRTWMYHTGMVLLEIEQTGEAFVRPIPFPIQFYMDRRFECLTA
jgi:hypothetical protein